MEKYFLLLSCLTYWTWLFTCCCGLGVVFFVKINFSFRWNNDNRYFHCKLDIPSKEEKKWLDEWINDTTSIPLYWYPFPENQTSDQWVKWTGWWWSNDYIDILQIEIHTCMTCIPAYSIGLVFYLFFFIIIARCIIILIWSLPSSPISSSLL